MTVEPYNVLDLLRVRNQTFLEQIAYHDELASTNSEAVSLAKTDGIALPLLVIAERQTAGRGRGTNRWWSDDGALTFTLLVDLPSLPPESIGSISLTVGVAICQALERFSPTADIALKWPNDVFLDGKKIVGTLVERPASPSLRLAIGIGINVNNSLKHAPRELQSTATSLWDSLSGPTDRTTLLIECLQHLERHLGDHSHRRDALCDQWRAYSLLTGRIVSVDAHGTLITGTCVGIDEDGALLVRKGDRLQRCIAGEVRMFE